LTTDFEVLVQLRPLSSVSALRCRMPVDRLPHVHREQVIYEGLCDGQGQSTEEYHEERYYGELGCHGGRYPKGVQVCTNTVHARIHLTWAMASLPACSNFSRYRRIHITRFVTPWKSRRQTKRMFQLVQSDVMDQPVLPCRNELTKAVRNGCGTLARRFPSRNPTYQRHR
jgi:hypothetical protein